MLIKNLKLQEYPRVRLKQILWRKLLDCLPQVSMNIFCLYYVHTYTWYIQRCCCFSFPFKYTSQVLQSIAYLALPASSSSLAALWQAWRRALMQTTVNAMQNAWRSFRIVCASANGLYMQHWRGSSQVYAVD